MACPRAPFPYGKGSGRDQTRVWPYCVRFLIHWLVFNSIFYRGILVRVSTIGYGREPEFEVDPPGSPSKEVRLAWSVLSRPAFKAACEKEALRVDWEALKRIVDRGSRRGSSKRGVWSTASKL